MILLMRSTSAKDKVMTVTHRSGYIGTYMYSMCVFSIVFRKFQVGGDTPLAQLILIQQLWGHSIKRMTTVEANSSSNRNWDSRTWGRSSLESSSCWAWWGLTTKIRSESGRRVGDGQQSRLFMIELLAAKQILSTNLKFILGTTIQQHHYILHHPSISSQ